MVVVFTVATCIIKRQAGVDGKRTPVHHIIIFTIIIISHGSIGVTQG